MGLLNKFRKTALGNLSDEVLESIQHLLSMKQTFGAWQKGLGLDDYSYANEGEEIVNKIVKDIWNNIKNFEKRFQIKKIDLVGPFNPARLTFELHGILEGKPQNYTIQITR